MVLVNIFWPTFALVGLVFAVWMTLFVQRFAHMKRTPPTATDFADGDAAMRYFRPVEMPANNLANLFELPVLYFALVPLLLITGSIDGLQVLLAWAFVLLRVGHSIIHIGPKKVQARFIVYLLSTIVLVAMWVGFFVDMVWQAYAYSHAIVALAPA
ncbi:MAPEG family protein [Sphingomonas oligophenolica]|nr:MAPEG family protein [Sphingomonas oligophenolica]